MWPHPLSINYLPKLTADAEAEGAEYCRQHESKLAILEPDVEEYFQVSCSARATELIWQLLVGRHKPKREGETILESRIRCIKSVEEVRYATRLSLNSSQYLQLLLQISIDCASQQMGKPLHLKSSEIVFIDEVDMAVKPWNTTMIVDSEGVFIDIVLTTNCAKLSQTSHF